jgi:Fe2+ transport system protein FeoA
LPFTVRERTMTMLADQTGTPLSLTQLKRGVRARIDGCSLDGACAAMIESMGLDRDAVVSVARVGDPCVVLVHHRCGGSCRIGLRKDLASRIAVRPASDG